MRKLGNIVAEFLNVLQVFVLFTFFMGILLILGVFDFISRALKAVGSFVWARVIR